MLTNLRSRTSGVTFQKLRGALLPKPGVSATVLALRWMVVVFVVFQLAGIVYLASFVRRGIQPLPAASSSIHSPDDESPARISARTKSENQVHPAAAAVHTQQAAVRPSAPPRAAPLIGATRPTASATHASSATVASGPAASSPTGAPAHLQATVPSSVSASADASHGVSASASDPREPTCAHLSPADAACEPHAPNFHACRVDAVYTYVDHADPVWRAQFQPAAERASLVRDRVDPVIPSSILHKYHDWGELRYSMRSLHTHAPWVRRIYIVVAHESQVPKWLRFVNQSRVRIVYHRDLFDAPPEAQLPTFNSLAIESVLHRIPGLSNHFLYLNNDLFIGRALELTDFITPTHYMRYTDWPINMPLDCVGEPIEFTADGGHRTTEYSQRLACMYRRVPFFLDRWLIGKHRNNQVLLTWAAHVPHMWNRCALYEINRGPIGGFFAAMRRESRFRDPMFDVSTHLQFEAWKVERAQSQPSSNSTRAVQMIQVSTVEEQARHLYSYTVFSPFDFQSTIQLDAWHNRLNSGALARYDAELGQRPLFIGIEDDMVGVVEEALRVSHADRMRATFEAHWPIKAPWEL